MDGSICRVMRPNGGARRRASASLRDGPELHHQNIGKPSKAKSGK
jgi:hypothetical protein